MFNTEVKKKIEDLQYYGKLMDTIRGKDDVVYGRIYFRDGKVHLVKYNDYGFSDIDLIILDPAAETRHTYHYKAALDK